MKQNSMLAMILAGGRGSRLHDLTNKVAKPAVSYGGKYRIVDFPLSNCANSGVDVVGVLTQYESIQLNSYVAAGGRWGLDAKNSGVYVLPPREKADENLNVYRGTADAISQNIDFIDKFDPEYVLVLSGDHIYKMNYDKMLAAHKEAKADATIAVIGVPMKEASRFGIMNTDESGRIVEFEEKPEHPKSNLASMGIYIFTWKLLRMMLMADIKNPDSSHDFGKDIIPTMLNDNRTLYAYKFEVKRSPDPFYKFFIRKPSFSYFFQGFSICLYCIYFCMIDCAIYIKDNNYFRRFQLHILKCIRQICQV